MKSMKTPSRTTEAQAIQAGITDAFTHWLECHISTTPEAVTLGVQAAVGKWLDSNEFRIERMLTEEVAAIARETLTV